MRRLVVELYGKELEKRVAGGAFAKVKSMELIHFLRNDQFESAGIWRMTMKDGAMSPEECLRGDPSTMEVQILERSDGAFLVFLKRKPRPGLLLGHGSRPGSGYLQGPLGMSDGRLTFAFVGTQSQIRAVLTGAEERGLTYRIVSLTDADFAEDSLLNRLTDKQRTVLILAFKLGYFDVPKRINSDELGARLQLSGSTVAEHLGKAERRLLEGIVGEVSTQSTHA